MSCALMSKLDDRKALLNNFDEIEKYYGQAFRPKPAGLREVSGHSVGASEDEK